MTGSELGGCRNAIDGFHADIAVVSKFCLVRFGIPAITVAEALANPPRVSRRLGVFPLKRAAELALVR